MVKIQIHFISYATSNTNLKKKLFIISTYYKYLVNIELNEKYFSGV